MTHKNSKYIRWNGTILEHYDLTKIQDYMLYYDGLISVKEVIENKISEGFEIIILFSCQSGAVSYEIKSSPDVYAGLFTSSFNSAVIKFPEMSLKDLIPEVNYIMKNSGLHQISEVICKKEHLDLKSLFDSHINGNKNTQNSIMIMLLDMCRSPINKGIEISTEKTRYTTTLNEFSKLLKDEIKGDFQMQEYRHKDFYSYYGIIISFFESGFNLWLIKVLNLWSEKRSNATIKISYINQNEKRIELTYTKLRKQEVIDLLQNDPPKLNEKIRLEVPTNIEVL